MTTTRWKVRGLKKSPGRPTTLGYPRRPSPSESKGAIRSAMRASSLGPGSRGPSGRTVPRRMKRSVRISKARPEGSPRTAWVPAASGSRKPSAASTRGGGLPPQPSGSQKVQLLKSFKNHRAPG